MGKFGKDGAVLIVRKRDILCGEIGIQPGRQTAQRVRGGVFLHLLAEEARPHRIGRSHHIVRHIAASDIAAVIVEGKMREQQRQQSQQQAKRAQQPCKEAAAAVELCGSVLHLQKGAAAELAALRQLPDGGACAAREGQTQGIKQRKLQAEQQTDCTEDCAAQQEACVKGQYGDVIEAVQRGRCGQITQRQADKQGES